MSDRQITLAPSSLIVFEGLDATGKSTQLQKIKDGAEGRFGHRLFTEPAPLFTHQPSGEDELGAEIYKITEELPPEADPWCRQFLHLASHANHYKNSILPALEKGRSVFMDRCWWSTFAYGYVAGGLMNEKRMDADEFIKMARLPTRGVLPSVVFLFLEPHKDDPHNTLELSQAYRTLLITQDRYPVIQVPAMDIEMTTACIFMNLVDLGLA